VNSEIAVIHWTVRRITSAFFYSAVIDFFKTAFDFLVQPSCNLIFIPEKIKISCIFKLDSLRLLIGVQACNLKVVIEPI